MKRHLVAALLALASLAAAAQPADPRDPFEGWNRGVYRFNDSVDIAVVKPVAEGYRAVVPAVVRAGIVNFFGNFGDAWSAVNQFLQGKGESGLLMTMRVATNSVFGIGGLFDVASEAGMERRSEDFGQTLGRWGMPAGPYLVLPLLGPSSLRESLALPVDSVVSTGLLTQDTGARLGLAGLQLLETRASLLGASKVLDEVALDKYSFVRDAYLARRRSLVYDGDPPDEPEAAQPAQPGQPANPAPPAQPAQPVQPVQPAPPAPPAEPAKKQ